ncbi:MAG: succinyl-diaminopimelate desuccinylase [Pseudomonadota bacterium]
MDVLSLTQALIRRPSVTPDDAGCQTLLAERLAALGFNIERLRFGEVDNLWATWGERGPWLVFAGHTDVVPTGPLDQWRTDPFAAEIHDGYLYGRGAADMKASLAAMICACEQLLSDGALPLRLAFLLTSDEEGPAVDGTVRVVQWLADQGITPEYCIVGEPSSSSQLADVVRNGRRGSLGGTLTVLGQQGHVAYPEQVRNPIHALAAPLAALAERVWDEGNAYYPPTSFQVSNLNAGTGATNVVPGTAEAQFNFRYSTEQTAESLQQAVIELLDAHGLDYELRWHLSGAPFLTEVGLLTEAVSAATEQELGYRPELSTAGGTSDGRFIARLGTAIVELGPVNASIHKIDERVAVADLEPLARIYSGIAQQLARQHA